MTAKYHDNHNHIARFSRDAKQTLNELCEHALNKGLRGFTLSDHYDKDMLDDGLLVPGLSPYGQVNEGEWAFDFDTYHKTLQEKQAELRTHSSFNLLRGIEVGYIPYQVNELWSYLKQHDFDSIILSVHVVDGKDIYHDIESYARGHQPIYQRYLELIVEMLEAELDFDIVGHYDYVTRYLPGEYVPMRYREFPDHFDTIFRLIRDQGKALELNTRSRYRMLDRDGKTIGLPDPDVYQRFAELGGEFVALSSDSHEDGNVGRFFEESAAFLLRQGIRYAAHYEQRKAVTTKIDV